MKLVLLMTLTLSMIIGPHDVAKADGEAYRQCKFQHLQPGIWTPLEERRTAWCALRRWPVIGGFSKLDSVLSCESGWNRFAYNPAGPYVGLAQHSLSAWPARVRTYTPRWWRLKLNWANSRTMLVVTIRMVHEQGWGAWSCA